MKQVKIAEFKSRLSAHLKRVRRGETIEVLDRETPIARVIPFPKEGPKIAVLPPRVKGSLKNLKFTLHRPDIDVVKLLREDRERR